MAARWIDLVDPTSGELLAIPVRLDPETIEILSTPAGDGRDVRPTLESHGGHILGVFLVPRHLDDADRFDYLELDVVATRDVVVTIRKSGPRRELASCDALEPAVTAGRDAGMLLHRLIDGVADAYLDLVDALYVESDTLEGTIDTLEGEEIRNRVSGLRHEIVVARRNAAATRAATRRVLDGRLDIGQNELFPEPVEHLFADTHDTLVRVTEELDIARDLLGGIRDYVQSRVAESQNEVVKKLAVVASLVLVPTLITGFFGQNFSGVFERWWWTIGMSGGLIVATTIAQLLFFRSKRWI